MALKISSAKKQKLKSAFNPDLHPRYPAGHPKGGEFMPKGGADYEQAIAKAEKTPISKDKIAKAIKTLQGAKQRQALLDRHDELQASINHSESAIKALHSQKLPVFENNKEELKKITDSIKGAIEEHKNNIEHDKAVKLKKKQLFEDGELTKDNYEFNINYRNNAIAYRQQEIAKLQDQLKANDYELLEKAKAQAVAHNEKIDASIKKQELVLKKDKAEFGKTGKAIASIDKALFGKDSMAKPPSDNELIDRGAKYLGRDLTDYEALSSTQNQAKEYSAMAEHLKSQNQSPELVKYFKTLSSIERVKANISSQSADRLVEKLLPKPTAEHRAIADKVRIDDSTNYQRKSAFWQKSMADFYAVTNGKGSQLKSIHYTNDRASANPLWKSIDVGQQYSDRDRKTVLFHEMGHHVEFEDKTLLESAKSWLKSRASDGPQTLSQLTGDPSYLANEIAYPDKFINPYVGKIYPSATEVFSMGLQHFTDKESMLDLLKRDREHFLLIVGAIHGRV